MHKLSYTGPGNPRIDQYLASRQLGSRSQISKWIKQGAVLVNQQVVKSSRPLKEGDVIEVSPPEITESELKPEKLPLEVLYEDKDLIVVNKTPLMVTHPGAGNWEGTLAAALLYHCKDLSGIGGVKRPGIVHRLDKGTSGVMVAAKNDKAHVCLSDQFKNHEAIKIYWALVYGRMKTEEGTFDSLLARSVEHRQKFAVYRSKGKRAITHYKVMSEHEGVSLLEIKLETGRTHQIRVHLTEAGHSIVGDPLYGGHSRRFKSIANEELKTFLRTLGHTLLHARTLGITHPMTRKKMTWTAPLPADFERAMKLCF